MTQQLLAKKDNPITSKQQLIEYIAAGEKPREQWRIGTEHEKFAFCKDTLRPVPYDGERSIRAILEALAKEFGWSPIMEGEYIIGLKKNGQSITLEPGGQLELSGGTLATLHETCAEVGTHLKETMAVSEKLGINFLGVGFNPNTRREDVPKMPKGRYAIMTAYMPKRGNLGLDMMYRTATVQTNLDYADEADMVRKFRTSLALQPIVTALFANSPFSEGQPNGYLSYRSHIWTDTDPDRCGMLPFVFEAGMGYEAYVDHVLDVPMYFVYRDGKYVDASGQSFRDFLQGRLSACPGERPTMQDWEDHMSTLFPEVRLKKFLEMRGADGGSWNIICALPALWVGLLYDSAALEAAWDLCKGWSLEDHDYLRREVPKTALKTPFGKGTVLDLARDLLDISAEGLKRRGKLNSTGEDERIFLNSLFAIAESGRTQAEVLLEKYHKEWNGDITRLFSDHAF
ncbi:glutamate--cysteine ligase [Luteithermobacter gelatinilyticus]|uniref:glutamate--cysteine ligase n=1 Tax=Luteithermobacter gelatinilyticus TaxID=2582913 RepID=UPI001AF01C87|nr:glutamate--cysteine ligase [Luteithermobacter gelatinilyticus]